MAKLEYRMPYSNGGSKEIFTHQATVHHKGSLIRLPGYKTPLKVKDVIYDVERDVYEIWLDYTIFVPELPLLKKSLKEKFLYHLETLIKAIVGDKPSE